MKFKLQNKLAIQCPRSGQVGKLTCSSTGAVSGNRTWSWIGQTVVERVWEGGVQSRHQIDTVNSEAKMNQSTTYMIARTSLSHGTSLMSRQPSKCTHITQLEIPDNPFYVIRTLGLISRPMHCQAQPLRTALQIYSNYREMPYVRLI